MKPKTTAILLSVSMAIFTLISPPAQAADPPVSTSVQRAACDLLGATAIYTKVDGADGFGPTNQLVLASTGTDGSIVQQKAGYVIAALNPLPQATQSTGFRNMRIIFGHKNLFGNPVPYGKCEFTFLRPNGQTVTFLKNWSDMRPSAPADWRSLFVTSLDFGGFNVAECTLTKVVCYLQKDGMLNASVYLGDYYVQYGSDGTYTASYIKYNSGKCSVFPD
ncbi:MAG: hypothetical protein K2Z81_02280 [Cyanobacteria bacterium]|nr:hypothetical protein [Cyanobacteriota bacterium]